MAVVMLGAWVFTIVTGNGLTDRYGTLIGGDFSAFYTGARFALEGRMGDLYDFSAQKAFQDRLAAPVHTDDVHPYVNPPFAVALYIPFGMTDYVTGLWLWYFVGALLLLGTLFMLRDEMFDTDVISFRRMATLAILFFPTVGWLMYGQNTAITLFLFSFGFVMLRRQHDLPAGIALGLLAYKPQLMLAAGIMLLMNRRWRALCGIAAGAGFWGISGLLTCPESMLEYARLSPALFDFLRARGDVLGVHVDYPIWGSHSFFGFCVLLLDSFSTRAADHLATVLTLAGAIAIVIAWWRTPWRPGERRWDLSVAATLALGLLVSPHLFLYDLMLLLLPLIIVGSHYVRRDTRPGRPLLDGGPVLAATALLYIATFVSSYLAKAQLKITAALGLPEIALQLTVPIIVLWAWAVYRAGGSDPQSADAHAEPRSQHVPIAEESVVP